MPQLDDPHPPIGLELVDDGLVVVDDDDVRAREQERQPQAIAQAAAVRDARPEEREQLVLAVEASRDHPVVDELQVARELGPRVGGEEDPPAVPPHDVADEADDLPEPGSPGGPQPVDDVPSERSCPSPQRGPPLGRLERDHQRE